MCIDFLIFRIGSGDSWRSCGIVGHFHSTSEGRITTYSSKLYKELQNAGHDVGNMSILFSF